VEPPGAAIKITIEIKIVVVVVILTLKRRPRGTTPDLILMLIVLTAPSAETKKHLILMIIVDPVILSLHPTISISTTILLQKILLQKGRSKVMEKTISVLNPPLASAAVGLPGIKIKIEIKIEIKIVGLPGTQGGEMLRMNLVSSPHLKAQNNAVPLSILNLMMIRPPRATLMLMI